MDLNGEFSSILPRVQAVYPKYGIYAFKLGETRGMRAPFASPVPIFPKVYQYYPIEGVLVGF